MVSWYCDPSSFSFKLLNPNKASVFFIVRFIVNNGKIPVVILTALELSEKFEQQKSVNYWGHTQYLSSRDREEEQEGRKALHDCKCSLRLDPIMDLIRYRRLEILQAFIWIVFGKSIWAISLTKSQVSFSLDVKVHSSLVCKIQPYLIFLLFLILI